MTNVARPTELKQVPGLKEAGETLQAIETKSLEIETLARGSSIDARGANQYFQSPVHATRVSALVGLLARGKKAD